jgi:hypothetical protein
MRGTAVISGLAWMLMSVSTVATEPAKKAQKTVTIPLEKVWAYNMPGTRDIQDLARDGGKNDRRLVASISESLVLRVEELRKIPPPRSCFAVTGTGLPALRAAHGVLADGVKPQNEFSPEEEITVVFFAEPAGGNRVHLRGIERRGEEIKIRHRLEPYTELHLSFNLALIPFGKLPPGKYNVAMRQLSAEQKFIDMGLDPLNKEWSRRFLCKPFSFTVVDHE